MKLKKEDIKFLYRDTNLPKDLIITSAKLKGNIGIKEEIEKKQNDLIKKKNCLNQVKLKPAGVHLKI